MLVCLPQPVLRPFVARLWAGDALQGAAAAAVPVSEVMLPTGCMHIAVRLVDAPLRVRESASDPGVELREAMVGGVRTHHCIREVSAPGSSVGAVLRPGAARLLFGVGAHELSGRHTPLAALWGAGAGRLRERLLEARDAAGRLALFEAVLAARLPRVHAMHPAVVAMLEQDDVALPIASFVAASGLSHRSFNLHFTRAVGVAPKAWQRLRRFQHALRRLRGGDPLAMVAADSGYSDQAHFCREFVAFSGVTPTLYRRLRPTHANHIPLSRGQIPSRPHHPARR